MIGLTHIQTIGDVSYDIDDGNTHPTGLGDMEGQGVLFNIVAAVALPNGPSNPIYEGERRNAWDALKKTEGALKAIGYEFSHKKEQGLKPPEDHLAIDEHVAWLQVVGLPASYPSDPEQAVEALKRDVSVALNHISGPGGSAGRASKAR